jgi:hypothetical protein
MVSSASKYLLSVVSTRVCPQLQVLHELVSSLHAMDESICGVWGHVCDMIPSVCELLG